MLKRLQYLSRGTILALCSLVLAVLLVACGGSTTSGATSTPTPAPTFTPTAVPTPTSPSTTPTGAMVVYPGNGFTISYPQNWQIATRGNNLFTFTDNSGNIKLTITVAPDPNGAISASSVAAVALQAAQALLKNSQTISVPATTTVGGDSWSQVSISGTQRLNNQDTNIQVVAIANVHPANSLLSKSFNIVYQAPVATFSQANTTYFQPMLQSFKFA
jgi:hypothetical protein